MYHRLTPRDQATDLLRVVSRRIVLSSTAGALIRSYVVPSERTLLVSSINIWASAGAAQTVDRFSLQLLTPSFEEIGEWTRLPLRDNVVFAQPTGWFEMTGSPALIVPPNTTINFVAIFNAGVNLNSMTVALNGIEIPHGTFSE